MESSHFTSVVVDRGSKVPAHGKLDEEYKSWIAGHGSMMSDAVVNYASFRARGNSEHSRSLLAQGHDYANHSRCWVVTICNNRSKQNIDLSQNTKRCTRCWLQSLFSDRRKLS